jgi:5-methylthioadenosine/S-adenosylhomocysteine deaminase
VIDILIRNVTAVTMDAARRVMSNAWIAIKADQVVGVGSGAAAESAYGNAKRVIDGSDMVAIPGLIDCHSHAGHGLVRSLGAGDGNAWFKACADIYAHHSTVEFWRAEARLALLERLKAGVTTSLTLLGGGADVYRTDDPAFGDVHCEATLESGLRTILAVGPGKRPFPLRFSRITEGRSDEHAISFSRQLEVSEILIERWNDVRARRTGICLILPVYTAEDMAKEPGARSEIEMMSSEISALRSKHNVLFTQDGHSSGSIKIARDLGLTGPFALLSHSVNLTEEDIAALRDSGSSVVHNPSAIMSVYGRCPAPELIGEGVTVCIGSDAGAPDRGFDMFKHMAQCMHYHRRHFRDPAWMPPGKVLEMTTIDAARALGLDDTIGSIEVGKKADIVLVNMRKPHLYPPNMPVTRLAHFANAADVDTVIVDGKVLLFQRVCQNVDDNEILDSANNELAQVLERAGLEHLTTEPPDFWGVNRRDIEEYPVKK